MSSEKNGESIIIPGEDEARITKLAPDGKPLRFLFDDVTTQIEAIERGCKISENGRCVGKKTSDSEYTWLTYQEFFIKAKNFGSGMMNMGFNLGQSTRIGIYAQNSVEWVTTQYACYYYSSPIIPLYDSLGPDASTYMIMHGDVKIVICDCERKVKSLLEESDKVPCLEHIICTFEISKDLRMLGYTKMIKLHLFENIEAYGELKPVPVKLPKPSDISEICYTSGTTGDPKGAIITHENIVSATCGIVLEMGPVHPDQNDTLISYLPLAHVMEQACESITFLTGGSIGYFNGDLTLLLDDMKALQPTFFPAVPRSMNKLYDKALAQVNFGKMKTNSFEEETFKKGSAVPKWDKDLFKFFGESLGGKVRLILTAAAPVSSIVLSFYQQVLSCQVASVYGQTETMGPCCANIVKGNSIDHVGVPIASCMVKLVDVPELGYFSKNDIGEMCVKGYNVFQGYFKDPVKTAETIDETGWMHTGDIGMWLPSGNMKIVDRIKHIFKLSQGEYVAPERIENIYLQSQYISQILVDGDSLQSFLVAIIMPDQDVVMAWCKENLKISNFEEACKNLKVKKLILEDMHRIGKSLGLLSFEQVKNIHLYPKLLTLEDGHLTPTLKTKRSVCKTFFKEEIRAMYAEGEIGNKIS